MINIKFSLINSDSVKIVSDNKLNTSWRFIKNQISAISESFSESSDTEGSILINLNDYLTFITSYQEGWEKRNIKFIKNKQLEKIEKQNEVKEINVTEKQLTQKLKKEGFKRKLTKEQLRNVLKMIKFNSSASFSVPGAGKTTEALAFYAYKKNESSKIIVFCPKNAFSSWDNELIECFTNHESFFRMNFNGRETKKILKRPLFNEHLLINYEKVRGDGVRDALEEFIGNNSPSDSFMFLDESHRIKNPSSVQSKAILSLNHLPGYKLILTGTPCPNSVEDLIPQFEFLFPTKLFSVTNISDKMNPHYCRTNKKELFKGFKKPKRDPKEIEMNLGQLEVYNNIVTDIELVSENLSIEEEDRIKSIRKRVMWLIQLASNPQLLHKLEEEDFLPKGILKGAESEKINYAVEKAHKLINQNKKVLIWTNFRGNISVIERLLLHFNPTFIDGSIQVADNDDDKKNNTECREYRINKFLNDDSCKVMIANPAAASESISLHTVCHDAIYVDRTFNAGQYLQSLDRIHRLGIKKDTQVTFYEPYHPNTIDEYIKERLVEKIEVMEKVLGGDEILIPEGFKDDYYSSDTEDDFTVIDIPENKVLEISSYIKKI